MIENRNKKKIVINKIKNKIDDYSAIVVYDSYYGIGQNGPCRFIHKFIFNEVRDDQDIDGYYEAY